MEKDEFGTRSPRRFRDQRRALHAYECAGAVSEEARDDYKNAAQNFGRNVMRLGLSGAIAVLERDRARDGVQRYMTALCTAGVSGLDGVTVAEMPATVRCLEAKEYMCVTREILDVAAWLKRAAEATFVDGRPHAEEPAEAVS
jgi:CRISPR-associated protein Cmr5